ncbi:MAG TPA: ABC transporter ATP-binding protein [Polyangia bacterium]|nr:ABC transporter ATP-binding protein [Polyangia bacterium]
MSSPQHPAPTSDRPTGWRRARRALSFAAAHRGAIVVAVGLTLVVSVLASVEPLVLRALVDGLSRHDGRRALVLGSAALASVLVGREVLDALANRFGWRARLGVQRALLDATVGRLHALPLSYHQGESAGSVMTRLDRGVQGLASTFADLLFKLLPTLLYLGLSAAMMARLDGPITLCVLAFLAVPALLGVRAAPIQTARDHALLDRWRRIYARFNEVLGGIATVKSFAMEHQEKERFMREVDAANDLVAEGIAFDTRVGGIQNAIAGCARVLVLAYGGYLTLSGHLSVGTLLAFLGYLAGLVTPVQGLTGLYQTMRRAAVSFETVFTILEAEDRVPDAAHAREASPLRGEVVFEEVGFGYRAGRPVLQGIDLRVAPGETVALVGPSGGGKTTLMSLLQRLHDPERGAIKIDGVDIRDFTQRSLRRQIGVVLQDGLLFDDTVSANIAYGKPEATAAEIAAAARAANAHGFIEALPGGYDTFVGERGGLLSTGQRQRIAIARALLKDPPIVVLDEATSALDAEAEAEVQAGLDRLLAGRTTFVVAHRLTTVVRADRIVVLRDGRIVESGTHAGLLRAGGHYAALVHLQTRDLLAA